MKNLLKIKNIFLFTLAFSIISGAFILFPKVVHAGTNIISESYMQCGVHGHNDEKYCGYSTDVYGGVPYTYVNLDFYFKGHRHGGSAMQGSICLSDQYFTAGPCRLYSCSGDSCGTEYGGTHPWDPKFSGNFELTLPQAGAFTVQKFSYVKDAEIRVGYSGYAVYDDPPPPPPPVTEAGVTFHVHANCGGENIPNAAVVFNGSQTKYTDAGGYVQFTTTPNSGFSYSAGAFGYNSANGSGTAGGDASDTPVDVTLTRTCGGAPPPPPPPPPPDNPPGCDAVDDGTVTFTSPPPATVAPGQVVPFTVRAIDTGNTQWWTWFTSSGYRLIQFTNQQIVSVAPSPPGYSYGKIEYRLWPGDDVYFDFNLTAPSTPGTYTISMNMIHEGTVDPILGLWDYRKVDYTDGGCPRPVNAVSFGNMASASFTVADPQVSGTASINSSIVNPDNTTQYTITTVGTDTGGQDRIVYQAALVNLEGANAGQYRGYVWWMPSFPGGTYQDTTACTGSSSPGYGLVQPGYGDSYIHLDACTVSDDGANNKTVNFVVRFEPQFLVDGPATNNDISVYVHDGPTNIANNWSNNDVNFSLGSSPLVDGSQFISQSGVLATMTAGQTYPVTIVMKNTGTTIWDQSQDYGLGSYNPANNFTWGTNRNYLQTATVDPGDNGTFTFNITAPSTPGTYHFQKLMLHDLANGAIPPNWFPASEATPDTVINVIASAPTTAPTLSATCNAAGTQADLSWSAVPGATDYYVRVNEVANDTPGCTGGWYCTSPPDYSEDFYASTNYSVTVSPNDPYVFWVYGNNSSGFGPSGTEPFTCVPSGGTQYPLTVTANPGPGGSVRSVDTLINCGSTCSANYNSGSIVILQAIPASSYWKFNGWSGDCSGVGSCTLIITAPKTATATFVPRDFNYIEF